MLAYPLPEARALLDSKLEAANASLANCEEDLDFLREQITVGFTLDHSFCPSTADIRCQTMEVATARVYNWDVGQRRKEKSDGTGDDDEETSK